MRGECTDLSPCSNSGVARHAAFRRKFFAGLAEHRDPEPEPEPAGDGGPQGQGVLHAPRSFRFIQRSRCRAWKNLRMELTFALPFGTDHAMKVEENGLLVHEGEPVGDLESLVERIRDERDADVLGLR
jgi:hypothetical protein